MSSRYRVLSATSQSEGLDFGSDRGPYQGSFCPGSYAPCQNEKCRRSARDKTVHSGDASAKILSNPTQEKDMAWKECEIAAMERALELAARARGAVEPNPMVGAVIVRRGRIIAEGWHRRFGRAHAEIEALTKAGRRARGAEVFVTLEPCSHFGKTPPCADALVKAGVSRVVVAMKDPFGKVRGRGIARLRAAGIRVDVGLLGREARRLNAPYIKLCTSGLPYVTLKFAMTADGNIAAANGDSRWVAGEASRRLVHRLRRLSDAIVAGVGTAIIDDPLLTARPPGGRVLTRVVLDSKARLPLSSRLVRTARRTPLVVVATKSAPTARRRALERAGAEVIVQRRRGRVDIRALLRLLGRREMTNVIVEGGALVAGSFLSARVVDEVLIFVAPKLAGAGRSPVRGWAARAMAAAVPIEDATYFRVGDDVLIRGVPGRR